MMNVPAFNPRRDLRPPTENKAKRLRLLAHRQAKKLKWALSFENTFSYNDAPGNRPQAREIARLVGYHAGRCLGLRLEASEVETDPKRRK